MSGSRMNTTSSRQKIVLVALFAVVATLLLFRAFASSANVTIDVEQDALNVSDSTAFGGSFVGFKAAEDYRFIPGSLEDWEFAPQRTYTTSNETRYASPNGSGSGDGTDRSNPISLNRAVSLVEPGDVVYLLPGTYSQQFNITEKDGTESKPIVFTTEPGQARKAVISHGSSHILRVLRSDNIIIDSLVLDGRESSVWGFSTNRRYEGDPDNKGGSKNLSIISNEIKNVGKENALNISRIDGAIIHNNYIHDAGAPKEHRGEGVYIGCGGCNARENTSRDIIITNNKIQNVGSEGIELKSGIRSAVVADNLILDSGWNQTYSSGSACCFGGAITVTPAGGKPDYDSNMVLERNRIGRTGYSAIVIGRGDSVARNNLTWSTGVNHRDGYGSAPTTEKREPYVTNNLFYGVFDDVAFEDNFAFSLLGKNVFTDINTFGRPAQQKANVTKKQFTVAPNADSAFNAWKEASF